ncbi:MAG: 3-deoxy-7-phosphoheptulonate synthase [Myxococcota bacterium]|nr:3-deoxy-7-phosphoheptulonate synthase [Myxococcota bacterium]
MSPEYQTDDVRIDGLRPLIPPAILMEEFPATEAVRARVAQHREELSRVLSGEDDRLLCVVGPCSIHDPEAALEYADKLQATADELRDDLLVVMRVYFEKPRTIIGWKGLINDPHLDGSFAINEGLRRARRFLLDIIALGLPAGSEFLDPISPQFYADLVAWGAIGARTSESQVHREVASGLSMPVGFKNGTDGTVQLAVDAIRSSAHPHHFLSVTKQGVAAVVATKGNPECHVILRGGTSGPNHHEKDVLEVAATLEAAGVPGRVMIDCSHANSGKNHENQPAVAAEVAEQIAKGARNIFGVMVESFLIGGNQDHTKVDTLEYGKSITDKCLGWSETDTVLRGLADSVRKRRG